MNQNQSHHNHTTSVNDEEFRTRFHKAFELDSTLTNTEFYDILKSNQFDTRAAYEEVRVSPRARWWVRRFDVPRDIFCRRSPDTPTDGASEKEDLLVSLSQSTRKRKERSHSSSGEKKTTARQASSSEESDVRPTKRVSRENRVKFAQRNVRRPVEYSDEEEDDVPPASASRSDKRYNITMLNGVPCIDLESDQDEEDQDTVDKPEGLLEEDVYGSCVEGKNDSGNDSESDTASNDSALGFPEVASIPIRRKTNKLRRPRSLRNLDEEVLKHRIETKSTLWIRTLAGNLFGRPLDPAEILVPDAVEKLKVDLQQGKHVLPHLNWKPHSVSRSFAFIGSPILKDSRRLYYSSVEIDDVVFRVGDFCLTSPGVIEKPFGKSRTRNFGDDPDRGLSAAGQRKPWFARIVSLYKNQDPYAFETEPEGCHLQWFEHGSDTILGTIAGSHEIFELSQCDDNPLTCISCRIQVDYVGQQSHDYLSGVVETKYTRHKYFNRFVYDEEEVSFKHSPIPSPINPKSRLCACRRVEEQKDFLRDVIIGQPSHNGSIGGFEKEGVRYHMNDFIYIDPPHGGPYQIGQIVLLEARKGQKFTSRSEPHIQVTVLIFERHNATCQKWWTETKMLRKHKIRDCRRLYASKAQRIVSPNVIEGKCQVRHLDDIQDLDTYKDQKDTFWFDCSGHRDNDYQLRFDPIDAKNIQYCNETERELLERQSLLQDFHKIQKPLDTLELFAGCGGLSLGLESSGALQPKWAVEFAPSPAKVYRRNFPNATVYNEDGSQALQRAIAEDSGLDTSSYVDIEDKPVQIPMPARGAVRCLIGGFPCPGYSGMNRSPLSNDIKNTLLCLNLSFTDFYRPEFVLLENVTGLLNHKLDAKQVTKSKTEGGIEKGTIKFILRALTSLGYACHFTTLQASEFQIPQSRRRVFIWASLTDLPNFPQATSMVTENITPESWHRTKVSAPHKEVTVGDALTDLPQFDWVNPHYVLEPTDVEAHDRMRRSGTISQMEIDPANDFVGLVKQPYRSEPLSEYQRKMRRGVRNVEICDHVTTAFNDSPVEDRHGFITRATTERVCNIPLRPDANHRGLPEILKPRALAISDNTGTSSSSYYNDLYGRLDMEKLFKVCLTSTNPSGRNGRVLHPTQHRIVSVREYARAQSFPDRFLFIGVETKRAYQMIGNAVPPVLAEELGNELLETRFRAWLKEKEEGAAKKAPEIIDLTSDEG